MLNSGNKVNAINLNYTRKLELKIWKTNIKAQKIDSSTLKTFGIVIADFQVEDKASRPRFFWKTFLVVNTKLKVILRMLFLKINNADMSFGERIFIWKTYTINKTLPIIKQVQIIDPKEFDIAVLNIDSETFVVYIAIRKQEKMLMYSKKQAQVGALLFVKALTKVLAKYSNYSNIFLVENAVELPENTGINKHIIKLKKDKQLSFGSIYSLEPVELETLKTFIKTNLANGFI